MPLWCLLLCSLSLCPLLYSSLSCLLLYLVIYSGGRSLHRLVSSCIVVYCRAHCCIRSRCHWKLEDGYLVEGSNIGIRGGGGSDKRADSLWVPRLTTVEVNRSVKSSSRQPEEKSAEREVSRFWQTSATFCSSLRGYGATRSISGKRNFSAAVRPTQPHAQQPQP